jgi:hypothetical protein
MCTSARQLISARIIIYLICLQLFLNASAYQLDPYRILNLKQGASSTDIKKAYRDLAKKHHPDKNPNHKEAERKFIEISKAYEELMNLASASGSGYSFPQSREGRQHQDTDLNDDIFRYAQNNFRRFQFDSGSSDEFFEIRGAGGHRFYFKASSSSRHQNFHQYGAPSISELFLHHFIADPILFYLTAGIVLTFAYILLAYVCDHVFPKPISYTKLPVLSTSTFRKGYIVIVSNHSIEMQDELFNISRGFRRDPIIFCSCKSRVTDVIALAKEGGKWCRKPCDSALENWILHLLNGEVTWTLTSDSVCPVKYE